MRVIMRAIIGQADPKSTLTGGRSKYKAQRHAFQPIVPTGVEA
jgi:hypothetical protein